MPIITGTLGTLAGMGAAASAAGSSAPAWIAGISSLASAIGGFFSSLWSNKKNENLQREAWDRQSLTSRVAELEKNGLNKQLATGMNPNYSLSTSIKPPETDFSQSMGKALDALAAVTQIDNMRISTENAIKTGLNLDLEHSMLSNKLDILKNEKLVSDHDTLFKLGRNIPSDATNEIRLLADAIDYIGIDQRGKALVDLLPWPLNKGARKLLDLQNGLSEDKPKNFNDSTYQDSFSDTSNLYTYNGRDYQVFYDENDEAYILLPNGRGYRRYYPR